MKWCPVFRRAFALLCFLAVAVGRAAPGDLDPSFAGEGKLRIGFGAGFGTGYDLIVQPDGKIVVVGAGSAGQPTFATARYQPDGTLDESFADNGIAVTNIGPLASGGTSHDEARAVALQTDGRIVVAGYTERGSNRDFAVVRYNPDGTLDYSFGTKGRVTTDFGGLDEFGMDVVIQGDGKIVVAGSVQGNFAVARYNTDGSLDGSFGSGGTVVMTGIVGGFVFEAVVTLQNDGKILVAGSPTSGTALAFYVIRLTPSGAYDSTFANNGAVVRGVGTDGGHCTSIAIQPGTSAISSPDRIVVAGYAYDGSREVFALMRFNLDGNLDTSFDGDGVLTTDLTGVAGGIARAQDVKVEAGGLLGTRKISVTGTVQTSSGGTTVSQSVIVRYNSNGSLDTSFDGDGVRPFDSIFSPAALAVFSGKIVTAGGTQGRFALARFNSDGTFDASFDQDGMRVDQIGSALSTAHGVAIQPDGKIVVAGSGGAIFGVGIALSRLEPDGTFDESFDGDGKVVTAPLASEGSNAVAIQPDGKIVVAGTLAGSNNAVDAALVRYDPSGALDATFAGGTAQSQTPGRDVANALAIQSDGKIVVAGYVIPGSFYRDHQILRFNSNGTLDTTFDFDGRVINGFGGGDDEARGVAIQPDGKIVVAGYASNGPKQFVVTRFNPNGSLDSSFDGDGAAFTNVGTGDAVGNALALDAGGRIVVAGSSSNGTNYDITVVRYLSNGSLDSSFGTGGKVVTAVGAYDDVGNAIAIQPDGKIVVAGVARTNVALQTGTPPFFGSYVLVRYLPDGSLDPSYGNGGIALLDFQTNGNDGANALALDANARAVVAGEAGQLFGIARLVSGPVVPPALANLSTRLRVETGDNVLIGGFIVTGTQPKKVILRAIGPSLNLPGQLSNPTLELYQGSSLIASNDDWQNQPAADRQAVIDSTVPPSNDLEAALVRTLPANGSAYTAIVRGVNDGTGIGVVEVFDLDRTVDSKLANISTRGFVQTGDNVLIAGTIVIGTTSQKVIVRAIGPSLPFAGTLTNPKLELRDANGGLLEENDDWVNSPNKQAIIDSTVAPTNDLESAIVRTLPPAQYTAIVRGVNDTTGVAVVEIYALP